MTASESYPREIELKFELDPASAEPIGKLLTLWSRERAGRAEDLVSVYYDTDEHDLRDEGYSLRLRKEGGRWLQTAKSGAAGSFSRGEWESEAPGGVLHLAALAGTPIEDLLGDRDIEADLKPQFQVKVKRTRRRIRSDGQDVEASLDSGVVEADGRSSSLCELELELKQGEAKGLFSLARSLAENEPLRLSFTTKAGRGYAMLDGADDQAVHAAKGVVRRGLTTGQAFQAIGRECLHQISANEAVLRHIRRPEALHQTRVGIRRFRAALSLFKDIVADARFEHVKAEMKWLGGELGDARNLDVFAETAFRPVAERGQDTPGMSELGTEILARQDAAYARARAAFDSRRYRELVLDAAEWVETGAWLDPDEATRAKLDAPVEGFAAKLLNGRLRKMKKRGKDLERLGDEGRHELRIEGKKLRYAVEFLQALPKGKGRGRQTALLKAMKPLQEVLGDLNDVVTGAELAAELARGAKDASPDLAFAAGVTAGRRNDAAPGLLKRLDKAYARFADAKPVW